MGDDLLEDCGAWEEICEHCRSLSCGAARWVDVEQRFGVEGRQELPYIARYCLKSKTWWCFAVGCVQAEAGEPCFGQIGRGGWRNVGERRSIAAESSTKVIDLFWLMRCEVRGLVTGNGG